jgi:hypothetical protein
MSKIRFIIDNSVDDATLTSTNGSSDTRYVVDNIQRISRLKTFRSDDTATTTIKGTLATAKDVSAFVIARHNFSTQVTYKLQLYSNDDWSGLLATIGPTTVLDNQAATDLWEWGEFNWGNVVWGGDKLQDDTRSNYNITYWMSSTYTIKSFILTIDPIGGGSGGDEILVTNEGVNCTETTIDCNQEYFSGSGPVDVGIDYYEIGRFFLGESLSPTYNISYGHTLSWQENTKQYRPSSGTLQSTCPSKNRRFEFDLKTIPSADRFDLQNQLLELGKGEEFFISLFPDDADGDKRDDYSGIVKFIRIPSLEEFTHSYYKSSYIVEEA